MTAARVGAVLGLLVRCTALALAAADGHVAASAEQPAVTAALADGSPVSVRQVPALLTPDYTGVVELRDLVFLGDVPVVRVYDATLAPFSDVPRASTTTIAGRMASVFQLAWPMSEFVARFGWYTSFDAVQGPQITIAPSTAPLGQVPSASIAGVFPRLMTGQVGDVPVVALDPAAQFTSHVVNLVVPSVAEPFTANGTLDTAAVAMQFYQRFGDDYDMLHIVADELFFSPISGRHANTKNVIGGIGLNLFDNTAAYGSAGRLQGVSVFRDPPSHGLSNHETFHQWGDYVDWATIAGVTAPQASHSPLWVGFETPVAAVPGQSWLRLVPAPGVPGALDVVSAPPTRIHPWQEYALGRRAAADVGPITLLTNQAALLSSPGDRVISGTATVTVDQIIARHGPRTGPRIDTLRVAYIVVSRGGLLPARAMSLFTWLARRLEDPERTGLVDSVGMGSFRAVTDVELTTQLVTPAGAGVHGHAVVDPAQFAANDLAGIRLDAALPRRLEVGATLPLSGQLLVWPSATRVFAAWNSLAGNSASTTAPVTAGARFALSVPVPAVRGRYTLRLLVQEPSTNFLHLHQLTPFVVDTAALPGAPTLSVNTSGRTVALSWTTPVSGSAPTGYLLEAGTAPTLSDIARARLGAIGAYTVQGVPDGQYFVRVRASKGAGDGPASNEVVASVPSCSGLAAPVLSGTGLDGVASLTWTTVATATAYRLEAGTAAASSDIAVLPLPGTSFQTPAPPGTYFVRVHALTACGQSAASNELALTVTPPVPPNPPGGLTAQVAGGTVTLAWSASAGATSGYRLEAGSAPGAANLAVVAVAGTSLSAPGVPPGQYFVRVRSVGAAGPGPPSVEISVVVP